MNFKQLNKFLHLLFYLQKKNTFFGFLLGVFPALITSISIEFFIGRIVSDSYHPDFYGIKAINVLFFFFISQGIVLSVSILAKYRVIIKNSYLEIKTVIFSELIMQAFSFIILFLIYAIIFKISFFTAIMLLIFFHICFAYILIIALNISVLGVFFNDFDRMTGIIMQMSFWLSPIIYFSNDIQGIFKYIILLNPFLFFYESIYFCFNDFILSDQLVFSFIILNIFTLMIFLLLRNLSKRIELFL